MSVGCGAEGGHEEPELGEAGGPGVDGVHKGAFSPRLWPPTQPRSPSGGGGGGGRRGGGRGPRRARRVMGAHAAVELHGRGRPRPLIAASPAWRHTLGRSAPEPENSAELSAAGRRVRSRE